MFKTTEPKIDTRAEQPYMGIRSQIPMQQLGEVIPDGVDSVMAWLAQRGISPAGGPFIRYHVINMEGKMDVEVGWPVESAISGEGRIQPGVIPAGRYASLVYTDATQGIKGNSVLIGWAEEQGIKWDAWDEPAGHAFRSRVEYFLTGPEDDPDPTNWDSEVAIKIADK